MSAEYKNNVALSVVSSDKTANKEPRMEQEQVIRELRNQESSNPVASAAFHIMAYRQRNRHNMTTRGLYYKLRKEGFNYQEKDIAPLFKLLADLGLAKLDTGRNGKVQAIRDFTIPIQQIGRAACGDKVDLNRPTRLKVLDIRAVPIRKMTAEPKKDAILTVYINGKPLEVKIPSEVTKDEVLAILTKFNEINRRS